MEEGIEETPPKKAPRIPSHSGEWRIISAGN